MSDKKYMRDQNSNAVVTTPEDFQKWKEAQTNRNVLRVLNEFRKEQKKFNHEVLQKIETVEQKIDALESVNREERSK